MSDALAVGLNLVFLSPRSGGAGRYAQELIPALLEAEPGVRLTCFVSREAPEDVFERPWASEVEWVRFPVRVGTPPVHLVAQLGAIPLVARRRGLDLVHSPANVGPWVAPGVVKVVTLLDLIWMHYPAVIPSRWARFQMRTLSVRSARAADRVAALSQAAKDDFVATLGLDPLTIDVTPPGLPPTPAGEATPEGELRDRLGLGRGPIVLCVAQKAPHKNLAVLVRAAAELRAEEIELVLPGTPTAYEAELRALANELGAAAHVHFPDWVSETDLEGLYASAACFVLPSLIEGFGIPIVEAMRRELPVACSNRSSLAEVAGDAALLFDPEKQEEVTAAIRTLLTDGELRAQLKARGRERAATFTWERTARTTLDMYRRALAARS